MTLVLRNFEGMLNDGCLISMETSLMHREAVTQFHSNCKNRIWYSCRIQVPALRACIKALCDGK